MDLEVLPYQIGIDMIPKIGSINAKKLIAYCGGVEAVFKQSKAALTKIPGIGQVLASEIVNQTVLDNAKREVDFIAKNGIKAYFYLDDEYPTRLKQCEDGPIVLFVKSDGKVNLNHQKILSIVGTRNITDYGRAVCENLVEELSRRGHNPVITSGLAYGVDICAHRAALKNGLQTWAVLGHGLDKIYPTLHGNTAKEILSSGALLSDFPSGTPIDRKNFIKRNRIIAGISDATLVVESAEQGGSLITADIAMSYNREVMAIPGPIGSKYSRGCNLIIKTNKAALIDSVEEIEYQLGWEVGNADKEVAQLQLFPNLSSEEQVIFDVIKERGQESIDIICFKTKLPMAKVSALLLNLEFSGLVKARPGKVFSLVKNL